MEKCYSYWTEENGNIKGRCCCNCQHQVKIRKHPWNKNELVKGSILDNAGYGCMMPDYDIIFSENIHGMCEIHKWRK